MSKEPPRTMSTGISITQLPPEILTKIFQNLQLPNRKSVRLSCKLFYDACNQISIISHEKFVFRRGYCFAEMTNTLLSSEYLRLNLEFQALPLHLFPREIWTHCGDKIYSLTLHRSTLNDEIVKNIIVHCRIMKHWNVDALSFSPYNWQPCGIESLKPFEELVKQRIVRKQLETFEVLVKDLNIWALIIEQIFAIFPNMKTFKAINAYSCKSSRSDYLNVPPEFAPDKFLIPMNLERLLFLIPSDGFWLRSSSVWNLRLKEFRTSLYHTDRILETLLDFISHQKLLEVISLRIVNVSNRLVKKLLLHIVKVCPNLRRLQLLDRLKYSIELNVPEFSLLLQKRLEFLDVHFVVNDSQPDKMIQLPVNRNLHTLVIRSCQPESSFILIMEYFQNLKHLDVGCCMTDEFFQAIIKNQANLEILRLNDLDNCTDFGLTGRRGNEEPSKPVYSISRLKNLQCLVLENWPAGFSDDVLLEFVFPKLKHLHIDPINADSPMLGENFLKIAEHSPLLEIVSICPDLDFSQLLDFCSKLKKLYHIHFTDANIDPLNLVKLIRACPSLRYVEKDEVTFFSDPFTNKISLHEDCDFDLHSECFIDTYGSY